jgi:hypothetical protein
LLYGNAEDVSLPDASFDLAISEATLRPCIDSGAHVDTDGRAWAIDRNWQEI